MRCPKCRNTKSFIFDTRKYLTFMLRSRRCTKCYFEWKTKEVEIPFDDFLKDSLLNSNKRMFTHDNTGGVNQQNHKLFSDE